MQPKPVSLFGIKFSNSGHRAWFVVSVALVLYGIYRVATEHDGIQLIVYRQCFVVLALVAALVTLGGRRKSNLFSPTCIWWNLAVATMCYVVQKVMGY